MDAYRELESRFARSAAIEDALGILQWDAQTMLPTGSIEGRSDQLAVLRMLSHEIITAPEIGDLIASAREADALSDWQRANLREIERRHIRATAVPKDLLEASTRAATTCQHVWAKARQDNDFATVEPYLAEVMRTQIEVGAVLGSALGLSAYDALLDTFDLGSTQAELDTLFEPLRRDLPDLIATALEAAQAKGQPLQPKGPLPLAAQEKLGRMVLDAIGFDFEHGRLDVSAHPFTGGAFGDVRITTRYDEADFMSGLFGVVHEAGHALYEQGRPSDWRTQPVGESRGMSVHESQSMTFELQAARSAVFFEYLAPLAREVFGGSGPAWSAENLLRRATKVEPGLIRVDADEITYPAHIMLRYELEKGMISGDLPLRDLPGAFREKVKAYLGLDVPDDRRGCLQDIHWYGGAFGYFPTYLVGAMTAAQLFNAARRARADLVPGLAKGDFEPLRSWMRENIHAKGCLLDRADLIVAATGEPLDSRFHRTHLLQRYCT